MLSVNCMRFCYIYILINIVRAVSPYVSLENRELYSMIEYSIIGNGNSTSTFILNQPYTIDEVDFIFKKNLTFYNYFYNSTYSSNDSIIINFKPTINYVDTEHTSSIYGSINLDGTIKINNMILNNVVEINQNLKWDSNFHGQTNKWFMGYFPSSYVLFSYKDLEVFGGKISRNMGPLNEYSLIFSNNPYSFHHYGFSMRNKKTKYSFYTTRLNDWYIYKDRDGQSLNKTYKRYWSYQKFEFQVNPSLQIALSESVLYAGENQSFVPSLINPVYFFYTASENDLVESNSMWDIQLVYLVKPKLAVYVDLFADDIIVNNELGVDARSAHPDRLGVLAKVSFSSIRRLNTLRYVRIWNETYTSLRLYENYLSNKKGIGFPYSSYESIKYVSTFLNYIPFFIETSIEFWREGNKSLNSYFDLDINSFPLRPISNGITSSIYSSIIRNKVKYEGEFSIIYIPEYWNSVSDDEILIDISIRLHYNINKFF